MPIHNSDITENFNKVADLLEIEGANPFRVRAYRNAARTIGSLSKNVTDLIAEDQPLTDLSGIGQDLAQKIREIVDTGKLGQKKGLKVNEYGVFKNDERIAGKTEKAVYKQVNLDYMRIGIGQARRGWLEAKDVLNTCSLKELKERLKRI